MDVERIGQMLEAEATVDVARATGKQIRTIRGVRGTPHATIARVATEVWREAPPKLPRDEDPLGALFMVAWEDGLVAVGLLAALAPDHPQDALEIALEWCARLDDLATADALGWLVLGPAALGAGTLEPVLALRTHASEAVRRAGVMAGMAMTPTRIEGPSAAPLRARLGLEHVRFVDAALSTELARLADAFVRDESAHVRKALRRVLGAWAVAAPDAAETWCKGVRGGLAVMLREEIEQGAKKGRRKSTPVGPLGAGR